MVNYGDGPHAILPSPDWTGPIGACGQVEVRVHQHDGAGGKAAREG